MLVNWKPNPVPSFYQQEANIYNYSFVVHFKSILIFFLSFSKKDCLKFMS